MLTVEHLKKTYGYGSRREHRGGQAAPLAVNDVSFKVEEGELFTLLGPSGCGKTTTLRSVAGLEDPSEGIIRLRDRILFDHQRRINVPANRRELGMVFQSYAIWPHMSVYRNVAFPLEVQNRRKRQSKADVRTAVMRALEVVELAQFADRPAPKLSGGQQQRLALARAIVSEPDLLLLDEPLSNLDAKLRETMRFELKRLQRELGLTVVYVTHDQSEALTLSNRIAVMNGGEIVQIGRPRAIYQNPNCRFVAEFVGTTNLIEGTVSRINGTMAEVDTADGTFRSEKASGHTQGATIALSLRPEDIELSTTERHVVNEFRATVVARGFQGDSVEHIVAFGKTELRLHGNPSVSIPSGTEVFIAVAPPNVTVVADRPVDEGALDSVSTQPTIEIE